MASQITPLYATLLLLLYTTTNACVRSNSNRQASNVTPNQCGSVASWGCQTVTQPVSTLPGTTYTSTTPQQSSSPQNAPQSPSVAPTTTTPTATTHAASSTTTAVEDALGRGDSAFLRQRVQTVVGEVILALEPVIRARIESIPIVFDPSRAEVNAYATCSRANKPAIAVTDGMLALTVTLAQLKATDEVYGTQRFNEYANYVAQYQKSNEPILPPPTNWLTLEQKSNRTVLSRQLQLFDEMIAFVFGHELAHHYLNHLPCTSVLPLDASEIGLVLTDTIPAFNQPNESAADVAAIRNVLKTGNVQLGHYLTEGGAIAQIRFFRALDNSRPIDVFTFERTHPPPSIREPIIQTAAQAFRAGPQITWPWSR